MQKSVAFDSHKCISLECLSAESTVADTVAQDTMGAVRGIKSLNYSNEFFKSFKSLASLAKHSMVHSARGRI